MDKLIWYDDDGRINCRRGYEVALARLASYEATGLTPDGVEDLKLAIMGKTLAEVKAFNGVPVSRPCAFAEADKAERLVMLPCKVGDTVYTLFCGEVIEKRIGQFHINGYTNPRIWADLDCDFMSTRRVRWDLSVGKDFFLTREEAEKALEVQGND